MRDNFARALENLGWVNGGLSIFMLPEEVQENPSSSEGAVRQITANAYARDPKARKDCLQRHGYVPSVVYS